MLAPNDLWVSVNISGPQFAQSSLVEQIREVLHDIQLAPYCLMLELTEGVVMQNPEAASSQLMQLRVMGVQIGLDGFSIHDFFAFVRQVDMMSMMWPG